MPLDKPLAPEKGWTDLTAPELIKWEKPGDTLAGILTSLTAITVQGKSVQQYTLQLGEKRLKFLGTYDILQKLTREHVGCKVRIKYLGEDETVRGGPNNSAMKAFSIQIAGTPHSASQSGPITDEDIPF